MNYDLQRFIDAQNIDFNKALSEIKSGRKKSHWIWYIFPQISGLGDSYMNQIYSISCIEEARAYLENEQLFNNLITICNALLELDIDDINTIMPEPDDLKLRSSMTLFLCANPQCLIFKDILDKYYNGIMDDKTIKILNKHN